MATRSSASASFKISKWAISVLLFSVIGLSEKFIAERTTFPVSSIVLSDELRTMPLLSSKRSQGMTSPVQFL